MYSIQNHNTVKVRRHKTQVRDRLLVLRASDFLNAAFDNSIDNNVVVIASRRQFRSKSILISVFEIGNKMHQHIDDGPQVWSTPYYSFEDYINDLNIAARLNFSNQAVRSVLMKGNYHTY